MWDALKYNRMFTDLRQVSDVTGSGAKMAQVGGNGVFFGKTVEKDMKKNMWDALTYIRMLTNLRQVPDVTGSGAIMTSKWQK